MALTRRLIELPWTQQPQEAADLNRDHAFARLLLESRGVASSWIAPSSNDIGVRGDSWTDVSTVTQTPSEAGLGSKGNGSTGYRYRASPVPVSSTLRPIVFCVFVQPSGSGTQTHYGLGSSASAGAFIQLYSSGTTLGANTRAVNGSGAIITCNGPTFVAGQVYAVALDLVSSTGSACKMWVNGTSYAGSGSIESSGGTLLVNETLNALRRDTANNFSGAVVLLSGYVLPPTTIDRDNVLRAWTAQPFDVFEPQRIYIPTQSAAAAAPTITALSARLITASSAQPRISYS